MMFLALAIAGFVGPGLLFAVVERYRGVRPRRRLAQALAQDLPYVLLSNALPGYLVARLGVGLGLAFGVTSPLAGLSLVLQWLVVLAVTELSFYLLHRGFHTVPALWPIHAPHHAPVEMDWLAGFRKHAGEALLHGLLPLPVLLLLAPAPEAMLFHSLLGTLATGFTHWNVRWPLAWLEGILVTPRYHAWHHAADPAAQRSNLAGKLSLLDRLFGSQNPAPGWPERLGLSPDGERDKERWLTTHGLTAGDRS
jgi:sterol desaturase/sphingolipid hydroxylase (fatty acid hydroxylase superfamily)